MQRLAFLRICLPFILASSVFGAPSNLQVDTKTHVVMATDGSTIMDAKDVTLTVGGFTIYDGAGVKTVVTGSASGAMFGATGNKIGFLGATPIVRPIGTTDLRIALINLGLYTTGGASPLNLNGGAFTASTISGTNETLSGTFGVTGNSTFGGTVGITGATTASSLSLSGNGSVGGTLTITGAASGSSLTLSGNGSIGGTFGVTGASTLHAVAGTTGTFSGTFGITGNTTIGGTLTTTGAFSGSSLALSGNGSVGGNLLITGTTTQTGNFNGSSITLSGNETIDGTLSVIGAFNGSSIAITGNETVGGTLSITGATSGTAFTFTGNGTVGGTFGVTGATTLAAVTATNGTFSGNISAVNTTLSGTLGITGALSGTTASFTGNETVGGNQTIGGTLGVTGTLSGSNLILSGDTTSSGTISLAKTNPALSYTALSFGGSAHANFLVNSIINSAGPISNAIVGQVDLAADAPTVGAAAGLVGDVRVASNTESYGVLAYVDWENASANGAGLVTLTRGNAPDPGPGINPINQNGLNVVAEKNSIPSAYGIAIFSSDTTNKFYYGIDIRSAINAPIRLFNGGWLKAIGVAGLVDVGIIRAGNNDDIQVGDVNAQRVSLMPHGAEAFRADATSTNVNFMNISGADTGSPALFTTNGSDTDVSLRFQPKGAGKIMFGATSTDAFFNVKRGGNADGTGQPAGNFAASIFNATNSSGENGLLVKTNWAASGSTIFEVGNDVVGGAYSSFFKITGDGVTHLGPAGVSYSGGSTVKNVITATATLDFPSTNAQAASTLTMTVTGVADGDFIQVTPQSGAANVPGAIYTAYYTGSNTVMIKLENTSAAPINPTSASFRVVVMQF